MLASAHSPLTTTVDDTAAAAILENATAQISKAKAIAKTVELLIGTDGAAPLAHAVHLEQPMAIALMGVADIPASDLLSK